MPNCLISSSGFVSLEVQVQMITYPLQKIQTEMKHKKPVNLIHNNLTNSLLPQNKQLLLHITVITTQSM